LLVDESELQKNTLWVETEECRREVLSCKIKMSFKMIRAHWNNCLPLPATKCYGKVGHLGRSRKSLTDVNYFKINLIFAVSFLLSAKYIKRLLCELIF
jgi:hypothetical protein